MKHPSFINVSIVSMFIGLLGVGWPGHVVAQEAILTGDATVAPAKPAGSSRMPASTLRVVGPLRVHSEQRAYLKFDFSPLPTGVTGTNIVKATLVLYVNTLRHAGSFDVVAVNGVWDENTVTSATVPAPIEVEATNVAIAVGDFVTVDLTGLVRDWVEGVVANSGLALIPNGTGVDVSFDSKEGGAHSAQLSIITSVTSNQLAAGTVGLANLVPAITNVTVMAGAGLSGGGLVG